LRPSFGPPVTATNEAASKKRATRKAKKLGRLTESIVSQVNRKHGLAVTLRDVLVSTEEGKIILEEGVVAQETKVLAQGALDLAAAAGRACTGTALGILAQENKVGKLSSARVAELTNTSNSHVKANRKNVETGDLGTFGSLAKNVPNLDLTQPAKRVKKVAELAERVVSEVNQKYGLKLTWRDVLASTEEGKSILEEVVAQKAYCGIFIIDRVLARLLTCLLLSLAIFFVLEGR
jgi:hypothetical protein